MTHIGYSEICVEQGPHPGILNPLAGFGTAMVICVMFPKMKTKVIADKKYHY